MAPPKPVAPSTDPDKTIPLIKHISLTSLRQPTTPKSSALGTLPLDIWNTILDFLAPLDLVTLAQLNSTFHTTVITSLPWRFYTTLFPTSRRIWALSWKEAHDGYFARTAPPRGNEIVNFNTLNGTLPQDKSFATLFLGTNRRVIEFFGASVRHRHDTFLTQTDDVTHTCRSWQITSTEQYSMGQVVSVKKKVVNLPPIGHHLKPAGLDVVGTFLFWVDYADSPLEFTVDAEGISFTDEIGDNLLWPMGAFDEDNNEELSLLQKLFLSWGESQFEFTGQMVCARASVGQRKQVLRLYDYDSQQMHNIPFDHILGDCGPWLGPWKAPWILPWGFDDDGNLLFKILDTRLVDATERIRCVQTSFNLASLRPTFSVEILEDIQLLNPWNFQMFSDQCWGYPARDIMGDVWCILRDLRDGNIVRRVGPLNLPGAKPKDYSCHISMFHIIFQDKSARFKSKSLPPAYTPLRIFPIKPVPPSIQRKYHLPATSAFTHGHLLYELSPPRHPAPPGFWTFGGEDAAERYLFFQGSTTNAENAALYDDWKKWVVWDSVRGEWSVLQCRHEWLMDGFYCLFSEIDGDDERVGLDWVRMELRE